MTEMENDQFHKHLLSTNYMPRPILEAGGLTEVCNHLASLTLKKKLMTSY